MTTRLDWFTFTFYLTGGTRNIPPCYALRDFVRESIAAEDEIVYPNAEGWYYQNPNFHPDPIGPFPTQEAAKAALLTGAQP